MLDDVTNEWRGATDQVSREAAWMKQNAITLLKEKFYADLRDITKR